MLDKQKYEERSRLLVVLDNALRAYSAAVTMLTKRLAITPVDHYPGLLVETEAARLRCQAAWAAIDDFDANHG